MSQDTAKIKEVAMDLDDALEQRDVKKAVNCFSDDCEIEFLGVLLKGKKGVEKWIRWIFSNVVDIRFVPQVILIDNDTFFEEFSIEATLLNGKRIITKQAEVLIFENHKIKSLRLYMDRLDFADSIINGL
ncbi:MAG: nuclear transport factor 2 family protein, partial [Asgard group archaeon]|nr:nuclear transport factor 2 family protein [Asgard group archaeon]